MVPDDTLLEAQTRDKFAGQQIWTAEGCPKGQAARTQLDQDIDKKLELAGWVVQDKKRLNLNESLVGCKRGLSPITSYLKGVKMEIRRVPGITLANDATGEIIYTPPAGEAVLRDLMANWEQFLHNQPDIEPLVRMADSHYQFEAIHPFTDGNGRTGRIVNLLFLIEQGLLEIPTLYLSRYIIKNKAEYYRYLLAVTTEQQWEQWILYMLDAVENTANWTREKIIAIRDLMQHTSDYMCESLPAIYSRELVELIFEQPYCRIGNLVEANIAKRQTASVYLKQLCEIGVLTEMKAGREKLFIHPKFMQLLTEDGHGFEVYG
jgi:Fic family protein